MKSIAILSTGNELLYGSTIDTNSAFISSALFTTNFKVKFHYVVGDSIDELKRAIEYSAEHSDIIIITGGLGPTDDDNTIEALRQIFGFSVIIDKHAGEKMKTIFKRFGRDVNDSDMKMAAVPDSALIIKNKYGLAPGFILDCNNNVIIALPGVPVEMEYMFTNEIIPYLNKRFKVETVKNITLRVVGLKESDVNNSISMMDVDMKDLDWGITAGGGICTITFVPRGTPLNEKNIISEAERVFKNRMISPQYEKPEEELLAVLRMKKLTIAAAESCTGGLISKRLTDIPGASSVFRGGIIAYSDDIKISQLNVSPQLLKKSGAVSEEAAGLMATGIKNRFSARIGISVTGIAGPGGGTDVKPVGTVCFGVDFGGYVKTFKRNFTGNRERIRNYSSLFIIDYLRRELK